MTKEGGRIHIWVHWAPTVIPTLKHTSVHIVLFNSHCSLEIDIDTLSLQTWKWRTERECNAVKVTNRLSAAKARVSTIQCHHSESRKQVPSLRSLTLTPLLTTTLSTHLPVADGCWLQSILLEIWAWWDSCVFPPGLCSSWTRQKWMNYPFCYPSNTKVLSGKINVQGIFLFVFYNKKGREKVNPGNRSKKGRSLWETLKVARLDTHRVERDSHKGETNMRLGSARGQSGARTLRRT